jgi:hypothetical protein
MSGYNAEHGIPAGDRDNTEETPAPEPVYVLPYNPWEFSETHYGTTFAQMTAGQAEVEADHQEWDVKRLLATIRHQSWQLRQTIQADDHRIQHIWEKAGEIADQKGYCSVFDEIMEELGTGYAREVEYCVTVTETKTYDVHVTASRNADQRDIEELISEVDLSDWSETDSEIEVQNYEIS